MQEISFGSVREWRSLRCNAEKTRRSRCLFDSKECRIIGTQLSDPSIAELMLVSYMLEYSKAGCRFQAASPPALLTTDRNNELGRGQPREFRHRIGSRSCWVNVTGRLGWKISPINTVKQLPTPCPYHVRSGFTSCEQDLP